MTPEEEKLYFLKFKLLYPNSPWPEIIEKSYAIFKETILKHKAKVK